MFRHGRLHTLPVEDVEIERSGRHRSKALDLRGQSLTCFPDSLFQHAGLYARLETLDLSFNGLAEIPPCIHRLASLKHLRAHHNRLRRLPSEMTRLKSLETLDVSHNRIAALPASLATLANLRVVNLSGNHLRTLDRALFQLGSLESFSVTRNPVKNVPRDVYVHGLQAIRRYFEIHIERPLTRARQVLSDTTLKEELRKFHLRRISGLSAAVKNDPFRNLDSDLSDENDDEVARITSGAENLDKFTGPPSAEQKIPTSDYGSRSGSNIDSDWQQRLVGDDDDDGNEALSCHGDCGSDNGDISCDLGAGEEHCDVCMRPLFRDLDLSDPDSSLDIILPTRARLLKVSGVTVLIPEHNKMNLMRSEFTLDILREHRFRPAGDPASVSQASPVVLLGPHGAVFYEDRPAVIRLPLFVKTPFPSQIHCLRSNTDDLEKPVWERIPSSDFRVKKGYILLRTRHFSLFTAVLNKAPFSVSRTIGPEEGGVLEVNEVPGLMVQFPPDSVQDTVKASIKVICSELLADARTNLDPSDAQATPAVILQPHGYLFNNASGRPVMVRLPVPDYGAIIQSFGFEAQLTVWQSPTTEDQPVAWEALPTDFKLVSDGDGHFFIELPVGHFSWLTVMWARIRSKMLNARLGLGFAYSGSDVNMKCKAGMLENPDTGKFGLLVLCYDSDNPLLDVGSYAKNVGGSLKPVCISPGGTIIVKLGKSDYFEADTAAGEDESLEQVEENYRGGGFEKQFACKFKGQPSNRDIFGKVFVRRRWEDGTEERLFEFNLIKKLDEPAPPADDPWTLAPLRQLADDYGITTGDNWKQFARALGFSLQDLRTKFGRSPDKFATIIAEYRRQGGMHDDFLQSLNQVGRELRLGDAEQAEESEQQQQQQQGNQPPGWMEMLSLGWFGSSGSAARSSTPTMTQTTPGRRDETQAGPSGLHLSSPSRKRVCSTCEAQTPTVPPGVKRLRREAPSAASSASVSSTVTSPEDTLMESLHISPEPRLPTPPRSPSSSMLGTLPTFSRYSPPLGTNTNRHSHTAMVQSHMGSAMSTGHSSHLPNQYYNTPLTETPYGSVPSTSNQNMPMMREGTHEHLMRTNTEEITQSQLYRIAPLIQPHWLKVARFVRDDETLEADLRAIRENYTGPEEQTVQMLLQWRDKCPDICTKGRLYAALCDLNLKTIAKKCNQVYNRS